MHAPLTCCKVVFCNTKKLMSFECVLINQHLIYCMGSDHSFDAGFIIQSATFLHSWEQSSLSKCGVEGSIHPCDANIKHQLSYLLGIVCNRCIHSFHSIQVISVDIESDQVDSDPCWSDLYLSVIFILFLLFFFSFISVQVDLDFMSWKWTFDFWLVLICVQFAYHGALTHFQFVTLVNNMLFFYFISYMIFSSQWIYFLIIESLTKSLKSKNEEITDLYNEVCAARAAHEKLTEEASRRELDLLAEVDLAQDKSDVSTSTFCNYRRILSFLLLLFISLLWGLIFLLLLFIFLLWGLIFSLKKNCFFFFFWIQDVMFSVFEHYASL